MAKIIGIAWLEFIIIALLSTMARISVPCFMLWSIKLCRMRIRLSSFVLWWALYKISYAFSFLSIDRKVRNNLL